MAESSAAGPSGVNARQKRVLPSRSRRGGPGIGSCDVDLMILDAQKRRSENEPLIPASTLFLLTTNSASLSEPSSSMSSGFVLNKQAYQRYFDRPEVLKAYREQQIIQTPEFTLLSDDATVGGRFRPRGSEDETADTSDAAYEKRHRKYETFEKRQRLREKEKLKHEHYKLKERIEQLKAMDASAFLTLPASSFSPDPGAAADSEPADPGGAHSNAADIHAEGERRRKEMLDVAATLETRYQTLLSTDRKPLDFEKKSSRQSSANMSVQPETDVSVVEFTRSVSGGNKMTTLEPSVRPLQTIKLKIKVPQTKQKYPNHTQHPSPTSPLYKKSKSQQVSSPYASSSHLPRTLHSNHDRPSDIVFKYQLETPSPAQRFAELSSDERSTRFRKRRRSPATDGDGESLVAGSTQSYQGGRFAHPNPTEKPEPCVLLLAAIRNSATPTARKTQRHVTAFGAKVPAEIEEVRDFELPEWIQSDLLASSEYEEQFDSSNFHSSYANGP